MASAFEQGVADPLNPEQVYTLRASEMDAIMNDLASFTVRPMPSPSSLGMANLGMLVATMRCNLGTAAGGLTTLSCVADPTRSATGWPADAGPPPLAASIQCSTAHAVGGDGSTDRIIPCVTSVTVGGGGATTAPPLFAAANWDKALRSALEDALWSTVRGERGSGGPALPLSYDEGSVYALRAQAMSCCVSGQPCAGPWTEWGPCSVPCGGGTQSRTRTVTAADGSTHTDVATQACNPQPCCNYASCRPAAGSACAVQYKDPTTGALKQVTANSTPTELAVAMFALGQPGGTVLEGGTVKGTQPIISTLCDGVYFTGGSCSQLASCAKVPPRDCTLPCALDLPMHIDPGAPVTDFPANASERICGSLHEAASEACATGVWGASATACSGALAPAALPSTLVQCRGSGMAGVVVDPPSATGLCTRVRNIDANVADAVLDRLDQVLTQPAVYGKLTVQDMMHQIRCCDVDGGAFNDVGGCDGVGDAGDALRTSATVTAAVRATTVAGIPSAS